MTSVPVQIAVQRCAGMEEWARNLCPWELDLPPEGMVLIFSVCGKLLNRTLPHLTLTDAQIYNAWRYFQYEFQQAQEND